MERDIDRRSHRDRGLYSRISPLLFEDYDFLVPTSKAKQRAQFLSGAIIEPKFTYKRLEKVNIHELRDKLAQLEADIAQKDDELVQRVYRAKTDEIRAKLDLLQGSQEGDDEKFSHASAQLYGEPRKDVFQYTIRAVADKASAVGEYFSNDQVKNHAQALGDLCRGAVDSSTVPAEWSNMPFIKPLPDDGEILTAQRVKEKCDEALASLDIHDWKVQISGPSGRTTFDTNHSSKTVFVPNDTAIQGRKHHLTERRANALISHEIGTHVARRVYGRRSAINLLARGLAGYLRGEEGIATYKEQCWLGTTDFSGEQRYFALAFARGLDGTPRTFRELWDIMQNYTVVSVLYEAIAEKKEIDVEKVLSAVPTQAWLQCVRAFRGSTGRTAGAVFTKDLVYREGNIAIWELISKDPSWENRFTLGKYDPANELHRDVMRELGLFEA